MKNKGVFILSFFGIIYALSCCPEKVKDEVHSLSAIESAMHKNFTGVMIVDTIIYDVIIKNPNPFDSWTDECLEHLNKEQFVDILFESVYEENAIAHDIFSENIITPDELKNLERKKNFSRDNIGKIQFTESWFYNDSLRSMSKKVISISLGYEIFDEQGDLIGHKPAFKIYLN